MCYLPWIFRRQRKFGCSELWPLFPRTVRRMNLQEVCDDRWKWNSFEFIYILFEFAFFRKCPTCNERWISVHALYLTDESSVHDIVTRKQMVHSETPKPTAIEESRAIADNCLDNCFGKTATEPNSNQCEWAISNTTKRPKRFVPMNYGRLPCIVCGMRMTSTDNLPKMRGVVSSSECASQRLWTLNISIAGFDWIKKICSEFISYFILLIGLKKTNNNVCLSCLCLFALSQTNKQYFCRLNSVSTIQYTRTKI